MMLASPAQKTIPAVNDLKDASFSIFNDLRPMCDALIGYSNATAMVDGHVVNQIRIRNWLKSEVDRKVLEVWIADKCLGLAPSLQSAYIHDLMAMLPYEFEDFTNAEISMAGDTIKTTQFFPKQNSSAVTLFLFDKSRTLIEKKSISVQDGRTYTEYIKQYSYKDSLLSATKLYRFIHQPGQIGEQLSFTEEEFNNSDCKKTLYIKTIHNGKSSPDLVFTTQYAYDKQANSVKRIDVQTDGAGRSLAHSEKETFFNETAYPYKMIVRDGAKVEIRQIEQHECVNRAHLRGR